MNMKLSLTFIKSTIITSLFVGVSLLLGGYGVSAAGLHGHGTGGMEPMGNFDGHHVFAGPHHGGFPWLGLVLLWVIVITAVIFLMKWFKKKAKATSMEQFIQTSLTGSYRPVKSQKEYILDQWEKQINQKGNK